ncbi:MAG: Cof-type HAD-IIB family hydrolase [Butyrivibrio sp.]|nr:Cof-type HAD-IIB family hydrolase [Butyrivibrio sp.]
MINKKIFFADLDGTLLTSDKKISPVTRKALDDFVLSGNYFAINSGRGLDSIKSVKEELELNYKNMFLIAFNGAEIFDCDKGKDIYKTGLSFDIIPSIFDIAKKHGIHCHTFRDDAIITPDNGEEMQYYNRVIHTPLVITDDIVKELPDMPCKVLALELHDLDALEAFRLEIMEKYGDKVNTIYSHPTYLEIIPIEAGKGTAIGKLCSLLNVPVENSIAAGDEQNDISMIEAAGTGIAVANATDIVKASADIVTEYDNDHDGLAKYLIQLK